LLKDYHRPAALRGFGSRRTPSTVRDHRASNTRVLVSAPKLPKPRSYVAPTEEPKSRMAPGSLDRDRRTARHLHRRRDIICW
jgi:hypothetical protein